MARRKRYNADQRAERDAADAQLTDAAHTLLDDPAAVAALIDRLLTRAASGRLLGYSLRNQALLISQADARGIELSDVAGYREWQNRGRQVVSGPGSGLRIVARSGTDLDQADNAGEPDAQPTVSDAEDTTERRPRFRMTSVFAYSQTEGIDDDSGDQPPAPSTQQGPLLVASLREQLDRADYLVEPTSEREAGVDHADQFVWVRPGEPLRDRAVALAMAVLEVARHRRAERSQPVAEVTG